MSSTGSADAVVVIGGGPCGAIAASRLVAAGLDVTMLDAGVRAPRGIVVKVAGRTVLRWVDRRPFSTNRMAASADPSVEWYSSLSLGGLSNYWTGAVPRFAPDDFTEGGRLDERYVWPLRYDDLAAHYERAERMLRVTAGDPITGVPAGHAAHRWSPPRDWRAVVAAASARGCAMGVMPLVKGRPWTVMLSGNEFDSYRRVVRPLERRGALTLLRGAHALRIRHADGVASAVEYVDRATRSIRTLRGRAFVVAAGALDSTEILLRSVSGDLPGGLGSSHGVLGRYLHDHPREWYPVHLGRPLPALAHPLYLARAPHDRSAPLVGASATLGLTSARDRLRTFTNGRTDVIGVQAFGTVVPTEHGRVTLLAPASTDPTTSRLHIDFRYDDATVAAIVAARERLRAAFAAAGIAATAGPFHDLRPGSSVHFGGTARMHDDRRFGVVDRDNRVYDAPNVVVADASCFPTGPEKNPTLTAMAIASRAADALAASLAAR